ncbi:hypothetical protein DDE05_17980 [Streptomyces cavourensis]|nr:hypothetical protein DDE05_17980 [Streptomyces cavourensis]
MKKRKQHDVKVGDIYAVPLDPLGRRYGYVRMYNDPDVAILGVTSGKQLLSLHEISQYGSVTDALCLRSAIEKGRWPLIGNLPFGPGEDPWPGPRKQVAKIRPDLKMVLFKGHFISSETFGQYDELPELMKFSDENLIEYINNNKPMFMQIERIAHPKK